MTGKDSRRGHYNISMTQLARVDLVGVGLNATDTVIPLPEYPVRGSKMEYSNSSVLPGGQTASTVVACQTWGLSTRYVGKLGDDHAACLHREAFDKAGVEARLITVSGGVSPQSLILVDGGGERTIMCRRDESMALRPQELKREWIVNARVLHVDGHETEAATQAATWAHDAGIPVTADLDEIYPGVEDLLVNIDYMIGSKDFACRLMKDANLESALKRMHASYNCKLSAATLGENGVLAWDGKKFYRLAAFRVPVVDTTGAGDMFRAGFIYGLLKEWPLERQLDFSCAAAALNCMAAGARGGIKTVEAVEELMKTVSRYGSVIEMPLMDRAAR
jgi:sugar/nucleoside kinase (ribokinase family)